MGNIKTLQILSEVKPSILALFLLGIAELLVLDMSGNYIRMLNLQGSTFFIASTAAIGLFSAAILAWSALKLRLEYRDLLTQGAYSGAMVGCAAALLLCFFILLFALLGMGMEKLIPRSVNQQGLAVKIVAYFLLCSTVVIIYTVMGAVFGGMAGLASAPYHKADAQGGKENPRRKK